MAIAKAPLLSLGTRGKFASTLTFANWKGKNIVKGYARPSNPDTNAQRIHRRRWAQALTRWHDRSYQQWMRESWLYVASISGRHRSGYNECISNFMKLLRIHDDPNIVEYMTPVGYPNVDFQLKGLVSQASHAEDGTYDIWEGLTPRGMEITGQQYLTGAGSTLFASFPEQTPYYVSISKDGVHRMGLMKIIEWAP